MAGAPIDTSTPLGKRVESRLRRERIVWFTTVDASGTPQPNPVWFLWDGKTVLIYSDNRAARLRHLRASPRVSLNFESKKRGDADVHMITGAAEVADDAPPVIANKAYLAKYARAIVEIGMNATSFAERYSVAIRVTPEKLRGF